jgi:DEAD/DEAH box helicase domain-containing protein
MARRLFEIHPKLMQAARELVSNCGCPAGCPGCVGPSIGANESPEQDAPTAKRAALVLLRRLCE